MSYYGIVVQLEGVRKHPGADRLQLASCLSNQVVVGLEAKDGDVNIFFPVDGKLSTEFLTVNNLCPVLDDQGKRIGGGFFDVKGRVRAQKFRGERSEGFAIPLESLAYTDYFIAGLKVGDQITELNGHKICEKYITASTARAQKAAALKAAKVKVLNFPEHVDTEQFRFVGKDIPAGSLIYISVKEHGTSQRYAHTLMTRNNVQGHAVKIVAPIKTVLRKTPLKKYANEICRRLNNAIIRVTSRFVTKPRHIHVIGTRRTVLDQNTSTSFYQLEHGSEQFRYNVVQGITLHRGEILYGEVVGWVLPDKPIMSQGISKEIKRSFDKTFSQQYPGEQMVYKYGVPNGGAEFHVYRIAHVNEDGVTYDLPWTQVVKRCKELGLKTVRLMDLTEVKAKSDDGSTLTYYYKNPFLYDGNVRDLQELVNSLLEKPSIIDPSHIEEGVVLRVEQPDGDIKYIKQKSFAFGVLEGYAKLDDNYIDAEEGGTTPVDDITEESA